MTTKRQFTLRAVFAVTLVAALLANAARWGYPEIALFIGASITGSLFSRRFWLAALGGALGGMLVAISGFTIAYLDAGPPGSINILENHELAGLVLLSGLISGFVLGGLVGSVAWVVRYGLGLNDTRA